MRPSGPALHRFDHRRFLWIALIVLASLLLSLVFACAAPFAGLAALAALKLTRREATIVVLLGFLANQAIGFGALDYPRDASTFAWGAAMGAATLASLLSAKAAARGLRDARGLARGGAAFSAAFLAYEAALYAATFALGGAEAAFAWPAIGQVLLIDVASFVGLLALDGAMSAIGLAPRQASVASA
jgi:FtsH-binding integral membrane protein